MKTISISNSILTVSVKTLGAELTSLKTTTGHEYLWQGNPEYWSGQSPLLFPVIGGLPGGSYEYEGIIYDMPKHGFARKEEWNVESLESDSVVFTLKSTDGSLRIYPFVFRVSVIYTLLDSTLKVEYKVENMDEKDMPFQIGAHPAFNCPIEQPDSSGAQLSDYKLVFEKQEIAPRLIKKELLTGESAACLENNDTLDLSHPLFEDDALIFRDLKSQEICLQRKDETGRKVKMRFPSFTHFGIWKKPNPSADFICLEPWYGVDSTSGDSGKLTEKEGIIILKPGSLFHSEYFISLE